MTTPTGPTGFTTTRAADIKPVTVTVPTPAPAPQPAKAAPAKPPAKRKKTEYKPYKL